MWTGKASHASRQLPADIDACAVRIVQEAVTNVVRHAGTPRCRVSIDQRENELSTEITDDGRGGAAASSGFGIAGMQERAAPTCTSAPRPPRPT